MWVRRWHGKRYRVPRWREHGGPCGPDAPFFSFRRVLFSMWEWAWLLYWPDVPVYIPFWRMLFYNYRPHAAERADLRRKYGRPRGVSQLRAIYRRDKEKQAMTGQTGQDDTTQNQSTQETESAEAIGTTVTGETASGTMYQTGTNNPLASSRPETMSYGQEARAYGVFTAEMLTSLIQGHQKWGGWDTDTFDELFERAGNDWDEAVDAINQGQYQDAMRYVVNIANRMLMVFEKASAALNSEQTADTAQG